MIEKYGARFCIHCKLFKPNLQCQLRCVDCLNFICHKCIHNEIQCKVQTEIQPFNKVSKKDNDAR